LIRLNLETVYFVFGTTSANDCGMYKKNSTDIHIGYREHQLYLYIVLHTLHTAFKQVFRTSMYVVYILEYYNISVQTLNLKQTIVRHTTIQCHIGTICW
jgi:hypothetical protein